MTLEQWQPEDTSLTPDTQILRSLAKNVDAFLSSPTTSQELEMAQRWIKFSEDRWQTALSNLQEEELKALALMFTLAEEHWSSWQCGASNPAIWIYQHLKKSGQTPDKEFTKRLKSLTSNRYIPRGKAI